MQLTGKEIIARGIVTNYDSNNAIQQQGIDLRIDNIYTITGDGIIPFSGKTVIPQRATQLMPIKRQGIDAPNGVYRINPGYYEIDLMEGINVPSDCAIILKTRSSLVRCGAIVESGQFDAGFHTKKSGCYLAVNKEIFIAKGARIAQVLVYTSNPVDQDSLYNGQYATI